MLKRRIIKKILFEESHDGKSIARKTIAIANTRKLSKNTKHARFYNFRGNLSSIIVVFILVFSHASDFCFNEKMNKKKHFLARQWKMFLIFKRDAFIDGQIVQKLFRWFSVQVHFTRQAIKWLITMLSSNEFQTI